LLKVILPFAMMCRWFECNCAIDFQFLFDVVCTRKLFLLRCISCQIAR